MGEAFGVIRGSDYVYHENGQPIVYTSADAPSASWIGKYARTSTNDQVIGNINPDWTGGIKNNLNYKNFNLSFLIDIQKVVMYFH